MKSTLDRLNLRPQERRLVVVVALVLFVVLNIWLVWPYFGEWSVVSGAMEKSRITLAKYQAEIAKKGSYEAKQRELSNIGELLVSELDMENIVRRQASLVPGFQILSSSSRSGGLGGANTNRFFQEQTLSIQFNSGGEELIDFLVGIASQNALVRVRDMTVKPDPSQTRLAGSMTLVGNLQRRATSTTRTPAGRRRT